MKHLIAVKKIYTGWKESVHCPYMHIHMLSGLAPETKWRKTREIITHKRKKLAVCHL
jgi:hypothetical protein